MTEPYAALLIDPTDTLTLAQVLQSDAWRSPARLTPDLPPGTYWLRLKLVAAPGLSHWLVEIPADQVTGYVLVDGRLPPRDTLRTGFLVPPRMRDIATFRPPYLSLHLTPGVPHHLYLRVRHNFVSYVSPGVPVPIRLHPIDEAWRPNVPIAWCRVCWRGCCWPWRSTICFCFWWCASEVTCTT
ncbi:7TMR-DISMED2 domain-containing protein [Rhodothermus marinus]|uniref:7TMR-DISMED2 domain-containing protein n=1 Tax=Rhodothermus marinus TaxID=29549 RepID=UPI001FB55BB2|nr:7TM-DISM domain-containing protein [Rhodothermus marinus]